MNHSLKTVFPSMLSFRTLGLYRKIRIKMYSLERSEEEIWPQSTAIAQQVVTFLTQLAYVQNTYWRFKQTLGVRLNSLFVAVFKWSDPLQLWGSQGSRAGTSSGVRRRRPTQPRRRTLFFLREATARQAPCSYV